jgi:hypothetical protein
MRFRAARWGLALGLPLHACGPDPAFRCESHESCAPDGRCEPIGFCSFPDTQCPSGYRFAEHAGGDVAGACVEPDNGSSDTGPPVADAATLPPGTEDGATTASVGTATSAEGSSTSGPGGDSSGDSAESSGGPSTLADGLIVHLPLDDDFAAIAGATDVSGNELHAQCDACPQSVPGRVGAAAGFASDGVLFIADDPLLRPSRALSISVWALDADPQSMQTQFLVGKVISGVYNTFQISTSIGPAGRSDEMVWRLTDDMPLNHQTFVANPLQSDVWHHVAGVWDGSTATMWIDGDMVGQVDAPAVAYDVGPFVVGADDNDGFLFFWRGAIDEVRFYDRALTDAEIAELAAER